MAKLTSESGKVRAWQRMLSGRRLDLLDPSPFDVEIDDIAHGLARVSRWNGQTIGNYPFSVAQHSLLVLELFEALYPKASQQARLVTLLHDAPEYVVGDLISPFKAVIGDNYKGIEDRLMAAIAIRFGMPPEIEPKLKRKIKIADLTAAYFEATQLAGFSEQEASRLFGSPQAQPTDDLTPWTTLEAKANFLARFKALS